MSVNSGVIRVPGNDCAVSDLKQACFSKVAEGGTDEQAVMRS